MLWRILNCSVNLMCAVMKPDPPPLELWQFLVNKGLPSRPLLPSLALILCILAIFDCFEKL